MTGESQQSNTSANRSSRSARFRASLEDDVCDDPAAQEQLDDLLSMMDRLDEMRAAVSREGFTVHTANGSTKAHPLLAPILMLEKEVQRRLADFEESNEDPPGTQAAAALARRRWKHA